VRLAIAITVIAAVIAGERRADACISVFDRGIIRAPAFEPADAVAIMSEDVAVECDEGYTCIVTSTFGVAVGKPARATATAYRAIELTLTASARTASPTLVGSADQALLEQRLDTRIELSPADTQLVLRARVAVPEYVDHCFTGGVIARHLFMSSRRAGHQRVLQIDTTATPRAKHPASWSLEVDKRPAWKQDPATVRLWFDVGHRLFTLGGPFLMIGAAAAPGDTFRARAGWEVAIARPWLVFALAGETDFADAWNVALTLEPTSSAWVLPLSFGLGGGVVLVSGGHVGSRVQLSIALGAARVVLSVDTIVADGSSDLTAAGLVGVGF
jgi:hypothetical protein